jgi:hypothetical protein
MLLIACLNRGEHRLAEDLGLQLLRVQALQIPGVGQHLGHGSAGDLYSEAPLTVLIAVRNRWPTSRKNSMRRPETIQTAMFMPQPPGWRAVA